MRGHVLVAVLTLVSAGIDAGASAQSAPAQQTPAQPAQTDRQPSLCGQPVPPPARLPPAGSPPVVYFIAPCFPKQGGVSVIDPQTYLYYIQLRPSRPSLDQWVPYNDEAERTVLEDFRRLWATNFLDDLAVDVTDYKFPNGVTGKLVAYIMEERQRIKIVDYTGSKTVDRTKIEEKLKEKNIVIRLDSFIDPGLVAKVAAVVRDMLREKGYEFAEVRPEIKELGGGPKLVHLTFNMNDGPKVKIRTVEFMGNAAVSDRTLRRKMKENKQKSFLSFVTGHGTYQQAKFEEDADLVVQHYRDRGHIAVRVGQPELRYVGDSTDRKTRWVQLRVPVTEGSRYRVGKFTFDGNKVVKTEALRGLFKVKQGDYYNEKNIRNGLEKSRELYGAGGYFEFTGFPDLTPVDETAAAGAASPIVDVTMRMQEGNQYFVNRITFVGNTTTRDNVIRREMRLVENGVFNTEALKDSVRRLNQLGYFKNLEESAIAVEKTQETNNKVDLTLKLEEQNRNQLSFGAGVSQYEGVFGQLSFQTANFMGRGETLSVSVQAGSRAKNYQLSFNEPFLFDRNINGGIDVFRRDIQYISQFTQRSTGGSVVLGFPLADFTRMFANYSYERVQVTELNAAFCDPLVLARNPFLQDSLLIGPGGCETTPAFTPTVTTGTFIPSGLLAGTVKTAGMRRVSKITPSFVHNTVDSPIFPSTGRRYTTAIDIAGLGGNTSFYKPRVEGIWYFRQTRRTSIGGRAQIEYVIPYADTKDLPIFEKLYLGGEYSIRGFDIRSVGPRDRISGLVIGGNKSVLFNAEYLITIGGPVRLVMFYDAGQVRDRGERFDRREFKTSTGAEVRFFMPVLNVPFRLIFAYNPQRTGVLDYNLQPQKAFTFRFAVGSTF